ncbi:MAG: hypothetical protein ACHQ2E_05245 [Gemmatimonadales bacterium]
MGSPSSRSAPYPAIGLAWLVVALVLGGSGRLSQLHPPVPQVVLLGLTVSLVLAGAFAPGFRHWLGGLNLRQIVAFHILRFVGIYFLVLYSRGELPYAFAVPGGWGDIAVATGAFILVLLVPDLGARRLWVLAWNLLGLLDIIYVVLTASRLALADPASMEALLRLPLSLLPTFLVPLIIASHLLLLRRLKSERVGTAK